MRIRTMLLLLVGSVAVFADVSMQSPVEAQAVFHVPPATECRPITWDVGSADGQAKMAKLYPGCKRFSQAVRSKVDGRDVMVVPDQPPQVDLFLPFHMLELRAFSGVQGYTIFKLDPFVVHAAGSDPDGDELLYTFSSTGGKLNMPSSDVHSSAGADVHWDFSSVTPSGGLFTLVAMADDSCGCVAFSDAKVTLVR